LNPSLPKISPAAFRILSGVEEVVCSSMKSPGKHLI
jgi:hypothetical protein